MEIKVTIGKTIKALRKEMGPEWTQDRTAQEADISTRYYQKLEYGEKLPSLTTVFKLAKAFDITPAELIEPSWKKWARKR